MKQHRQRLPPPHTPSADVSPTQAVARKSIHSSGKMQSYVLFITILCIFLCFYCVRADTQISKTGISLRIIPLLYFQKFIYMYYSKLNRNIWDLIEKYNY